LIKISEGKPSHVSEDVVSYFKEEKVRFSMVFLE